MAPTFSTNNYVGRQTREFDPDAGTPGERAQVEEARQNFYKNRHKIKPSRDLLWRMKFLREKNFKQTIPPVKIEDGEQISYEKGTKALKRAVHFFSALQASDGLWPAENAGPLYFLPPLAFALYISGHLNTVFPVEHRKGILRYIYYHQNEDGDGDFTLKSIVACSVPLLTTFACVFLGKDLMVVKTMLVQKRASGFLTMAVSLTYLHGERLGFRYWGYLTGQEATR